VVAHQLRGPAWDVAEKFVKAAETSVAAGASVKDVVAAGVAAASTAAVEDAKVVVAQVTAEVAAVPAPVEAPAPAAPETTTPSS
jgi:hypothetical protein